MGSLEKQYKLLWVLILKWEDFCEKIVTISYIDPWDLSFEIEEDNQEFWWDTGMVKAPNNSIAALLEERYKYEF